MGVPPMFFFHACGTCNRNQIALPKSRGRLPLFPLPMYSGGGHLPLSPSPCTQGEGTYLFPPPHVLRGRAPTSFPLPMYSGGGQGWGFLLVFRRISAQRNQTGRGIGPDYSPQSTPSTRRNKCFATDGKADEHRCSHSLLSSCVPVSWPRGRRRHSARGSAGRRRTRAERVSD